MTCPNCFSFSLPCEEDYYIFSLSLMPNMQYRYVLTDSLGRKYTAVFTSDSEGKFTLYPPQKGIFNAYSGVYILEIYNSNWERLSFTSEGRTYDCFSLSFFKGLGDFSKTVTLP